MGEAMADRDELMTVGELAARTGLSIKTVRELEGRGLIYTAGRSPANYRLFDESALWCAQVVRNLRSLGLTIREIEQLAGVYLERPGEPIGPHLAELLVQVDRRLGERIEQLQDVRARVRAFRAEHGAELAGAGDGKLTRLDPHRAAPKA